MSLRDDPLSMRDAAIPAETPASVRLRPRRRLRTKLVPGIAMAAILGAGLASSFYALLNKGAELTAAGVTWGKFVNGETTAGINHFLQKQNPFGDALVTADRVINWVTVGDLGSRVRQGCPGWLFLTDELMLHRGAEANFAQRIKLVRQAADFLNRRNVSLAVVPVPDKSRVEAQHLCGLERPAVLADRFARMSAAFNDAGIRTVDLLSPLAALDGERYYRTDTHWNERGAKVSAEAIAAGLRQAGIAPSQQAEFRVKTEPPRERVGDLIRLAGLDRVPLPLRPTGDTEAATVIEQGATAEVGILDDVAAPETVLLGTSYSRRANFAGFLGMALGAPVENLAQDGGGMASAAMAYFDKTAFAETPPRLVIWEIPERFLDEPLAAADAAWAEGLAARPSRK